MSSRREKIRSKVMDRIRIDEQSGCWIWTGPTSGSTGRGKDYPRMSLDGQTVAVHLVMFTNEYGFIPGKKQIDHVCRNRLCVRPHPDHLEMVTAKRNAIRREQARAKIKCQEVSQ